MAAEVDSRAYHLAAEDADRTTDRHDELAAHGILPLHFTPRRIKTDGPGIIRQLQSAIEEGLGLAAPADHGGPAGRLARRSRCGCGTRLVGARASAGTRAGTTAVSGVIDPCRASGRILISKTNQKTLDFLIVTYFRRVPISSG